MRLVNQVLRAVMWLGVVAGLALLASIIYSAAGAGVFKGPVQRWLNPVALLGFLWVPAALGLWSWDGARPGAQSITFYGVALLTVVLAVVIALFFTILISGFS